MNKIEIPLSKSKLVLMLVGAFVFVILGFFFVTNPSQMSSSFMRNTSIIVAVGIVSILFFGFVSLAIIRKLIENSPGLIISNEGITDNSSGISAGFIPWTDVVEIRETEVANQKFINIVVKNPKEYIAKKKSAFQRKALEINYNRFGTVIGISPNSLKCDYLELKKILDENFLEFRKRNLSHT